MARVSNGRGLRWTIWLGMALGAAGCSTIEGYPVRYPWTKTSMLSEKYEPPPEDDSRYSNPPTYPKETMIPQLKVKESTGARPDRFSGAPPGVGGPAPPVVSPTGYPR
jgi:hypothetical protein